MDDILSLLDVAAQTQDWLMLGLLAVAVIVPVVLKALGKKIPLIDTAIAAIVAFVKARKKSPPPPAPEGQAEGLAAVVKVEDKKPSDHK